MQRDEDLLRYKLGVDRLQEVHTEIARRQAQIETLRKSVRDLREKKSQADLNLIRDYKQKSTFTEQQDLFLRLKESEAKVQLEIRSKLLT